MRYLIIKTEMPSDINFTMHHRIWTKLKKQPLLELGRSGHGREDSLGLNELKIKSIVFIKI